MVNETMVQKDNIRKIAPPGRKKQRRMALAVLTVLIAGSLGAYFLLVPRDSSFQLEDYDSAVVQRGALQETIQASGSVVVPRQVNLPSMKEGYAEALYVEEGAIITPADVLAELNVPDLDEELEDLQAQLISGRYNLEKTEKQNQYDIARSERDLERLQIEILEAEQTLAEEKELYAVNASRLSEVEGAEEILEDLQEQLEEDSLSLEQQSEINRITEESMEADLAQIEVKIRRVISELDEMRITSPISGQVLYVNDALSVQGNLIEQNKTLFTVADRSSALIELEVYEQYADSLAPGQVILMTISDEIVPGTIQSVGQFAETSSDGLGASVILTLLPDPAAGLLTPGATVVADLSLGSIENSLYLPRGSYLTTGSQKYVYLIQGDRAVKTRVTFGAILDDTVEVVNGLEEGDRIITSGYQNYIQYGSLELTGE